MAQPKPPKWLLAASVSVLVITMAFMMFLVILATVMEKQIPPDSRFLVVVILALGAGFGAGGMGGAAAARGNIPIPGAQNHALAVSLTGGVAVMIIVLLMRDMIVPISSAGPDLRLDGLSGIETSANPARVMVTATFDGFSVRPGNRVLLALCSDTSCGTVLRTERVDDPRLGTMTVFLAAPKDNVLAGYLALEDGTAATRGRPIPVSW